MGGNDRDSNFMSDASGTYGKYVAIKITAGETDYYGYHNANAMGKMEIALDLVTLVRVMEDEALSAAVALDAHIPRAIADTVRNFLTERDLWEDAERLYDELCSWRRLRFVKGDNRRRENT